VNANVLTIKTESACLLCVIPRLLYVLVELYFYSRWVGIPR